MKKLVTLFIISIALSAGAEVFTILRLNTPSITIAGKELKAGDKFSDTDEIKWREKQIMQIKTTGNRQCVLRACDFTATNSVSISQYYSNARHYSRGNRLPGLGYGHLSSRATPLSTTKDHTDFLDNTFIVWDTLLIDTSWKTNDKSYFTLTYNLDNQSVTKIIPANKEHHLMISRDLFPKIAGETPIKCTIKYVEEEYNDTTTLSSSTEIILIESL